MTTTRKQAVSFSILHHFVAIVLPRNGCLTAKVLIFFEINVLFNTERREQMIKLSGRRTVPQIFIGGQHVGGYAELSELDNNGELNTLLAEAV